MNDIIPSSEAFNGRVDYLEERDIELLKPTLEYWIKDRRTGEPLPLEVQNVVNQMHDALNGENGYIYLVAKTEDGTPIGMMGFRYPEAKMLPYALTDHPAELINAYVSPDYVHGQGVGTSLVEELCNQARRNGYTEVILNSGPRYAKSAWRFYNKHFGEPVAIAEGMYGEGGDAPIWRKEL